MRKAIGLFLAIMMVLTLVSISAVPVAASASSAFDAVFQMENWTTTGILDGTTQIIPASGGTNEAQFKYDVDYGVSYGVSYRTVTFSTTSPVTANLTFNWDYWFWHSWYSVYGDLYIFADGPDGLTEQHPVDVNPPNGGIHEYSDTVTIQVTEGYSFGFRMAGANGDWASYLHGVLTISNPNPNLVANGSFERPDVVEDNYYRFQNESDTDWYASPNSSGDEGLEIQDTDYAFEGYQYAELDAVVNTQIWQDIPTTADQKYLLEFAWSGRPDYTLNNQVEVKWNNVTIFTSPVVETAAWQEEKFIVTGAGATTELRFIQLGDSDGLGTFLDAVSVTLIEAPSFTLTPAVDFNPVGASHTVTLATDPPTPGLTFSFTVTGANNVGPTLGRTGDDGVVLFGYTGENAGKDTITATSGETSLSVTKYWLENFLTGGGSLKNPKYSFSGIVGKLDLGIVGYFQIVMHGTQGTTTTWICDNDFSSLVFSNEPLPVGNNPPGASNNTVVFTGTYTNGTDSQPITIKLIEGGESGAGNDFIRIYFNATDTSGAFTSGTLSTGNFQIHDAE